MPTTPAPLPPPTMSPPTVNTPTPPQLALSRKQTRFVAVGGLCAGIVTDQILSPRSLAATVAILVFVGGGVAFILERYLRMLNKRRLRRPSA